jgi:predicted acyl esterase
MATVEVIILVKKPGTSGDNHRFMRAFFGTILWFLPFFTVGQTGDSAWIRDHYVKKEQMISMRDNIRLFTAIYMPRDRSSKTHPFLILRTPYSCATYGNQWMPFWNSYFREYLKEEYIIVLQDVRGRFMSEGNFINIRPFISDKKTKTDTHPLISIYRSMAPCHLKNPYQL